MREQGRIGVCGLGLIGSSVVRGLRRTHELMGLDPDPGTAAEARRLGIETIEDPAGFAECDLVLLAAPTEVNRHLLVSFITNGPRVPMADLGSVKSPIQETWLKVGSTYPFVGTHPMAGSESSGIGSGHRRLFEDAAWPVVVHEQTDPQALSAVLDVVLWLGGLPVPVSARAHDDAVALASHIPHLMAGVLGNAVAESHVRTLAILLAAGSFRDATRVSGSPPQRSAEFLLLNGHQVAAEARGIAAALADLAMKVEAGDVDAVTRDLERANEVRNQFDNRMAFLQGRQVTGDVLVVKDALLAARDSAAVVTGLTADDAGAITLSLSSRGSGGSG